MVKRDAEPLRLNSKRYLKNFLISNNKYKGWYPIFITMLWTGMRVGEITGLRWEDVDFDNNIIHINHTLVYYDTRTEDGCKYAIHTPKTKAGNRTIPMLPKVKAALIQEKRRKEDKKI